MDDDFTSGWSSVFYNYACAYYTRSKQAPWRRCHECRVLNFYVSIRNLTYVAVSWNFQNTPREPPLSHSERRQRTSRFFLFLFLFISRLLFFNSPSLSRSTIIFRFLFFHASYRFLFSLFLSLFLFSLTKDSLKKGIRSRFLASNVNFYVLIIRHVRPWNS